MAGPRSRSFQLQNLSPSQELNKSSRKQMTTGTESAVTTLSARASRAGYKSPIEPLEPIYLESRWSFWFDKYLGPGLSVEEYAAALKKLGTFCTVQDFWKYFNNIPNAEKLGARCSYHLMREGIRPLWEDEGNVFGGHITFKVKKEQTDSVWLQVLLAVIGEQISSYVLHSGDEICGVSVSIRKQETVISIWNKRAELISIDKYIQNLRTILAKVNFYEPSYKIHKEETHFHEIPKQNVADEGCH